MVTGTGAGGESAPAPAYAVMLTGVGPKRAQAELVTHILYLAQIVEDSVTVMPFAKLDLTPS